MRSNTTENAKNRTAFILPASQLSLISGGTLNSTFFKRSTATGSLNSGANFKIYLKNVTEVDFGSGSKSWSTITTGAQLVYNANPQAAVGSNAGWKEFAHTSDFVYTGNNLAVFVEYVQTIAQTNTIEWEYEFYSPCVDTGNSNTTKYVNTSEDFTDQTTASDYRRPAIAFNITVPPAVEAPSCTTISEPADGATSVSRTTTIRWSTVSGASAYSLNIGTTPGGTDFLNAHNVGLATSYSIPTASALNYGSTYYVTVIPTNNIGGAIGCVSTSFSTVSLPCPGVLNPVNNVTGTSLRPTINWNAVSGVTSYKVTVGTTPGGTDIVNDLDVGNVLYYTIPTLLSPSTDYYFSVKAVQGNIESTGCTERKFTTGTATAPANDECINAITLIPSSNLNCVDANIVSANTLGATRSEADNACSGAHPTDDIWFKFIATSNTHYVNLSNNVATGINTTRDLYWQVRSGNCITGESIVCSDSDTGGVVGGLTVGDIYYVRVYTYYAHANGFASFDICLTTLPLAPANDECAGAISLTVNSDLECGIVTSGTTLGATNSNIAVSPCTGTADDDVWYKFTAVATNHTIQLKNIVSVGTSTSTSLNTQVFSGTCGTLVSKQCISSNTNYSLISGLTIGEAYYIRVYNSSANGSTIYANTFDICIGSLPTPPINDECSGAITLTVNSDLECGIVTSGTTLGATNSNIAVSPCTGNPDDDVWFKFTALQPRHSIQLKNIVSVGSSSSTSLYTQVFSGACGTLVSKQCITSNSNYSLISGLTVGEEYYVRVYNSNANTTSLYANTFDICIGSVPPPPVNDECIDAISLVVNPTYEITNSVIGNTNYATPSTGVTARTCSASGENDDIWYSFVATSANHMVHVIYGSNSATTTQVYSGSCGSLTAITCSSGGYGNSTVMLNNLIIGNTYYVRVYSSSSTATIRSIFEIAVTTPTVPVNDTSATATAISCNGTVAGNNGLATDDILPSGTCGSFSSTAVNKGVWYTVTAQETGSITIDACGTQYDAYLRVYADNAGTLTCVNNTSGIGYADGGCTNTTFSAPKLTFNALNGTTYYILLTGYGATRVGNYTISVIQGNCPSLSAPDFEGNNSVKVYPNPFTDVLHISDITNVDSVVIFDVAGRVAKTITKPENKLHLSDLTSGVYLVSLNMNDGSKQVIKDIKK